MRCSSYQKAVYRFIQEKRPGPSCWIGQRSNSCLDLYQIVHWLRLTPSATPVDKQARRQDALRAPYHLCLMMKRHTSSVNGAFQTPAKRLQLDGSECTLGRLPNTLVLLLKGTFYPETPETLLVFQRALKQSLPYPVASVNAQ